MKFEFIWKFAPFQKVDTDVKTYQITWNSTFCGDILIQTQESVVFAWTVVKDLTSWRKNPVRSRTHTSDRFILWKYPLVVNVS